VPKAVYCSGCCDKYKATVGFNPGTKRTTVERLTRPLQPICVCVCMHACVHLLTGNGDMIINGEIGIEQQRLEISGRSD